MEGAAAGLEGGWAEMLAQNLAVSCAHAAGLDVRRPLRQRPWLSPRTRPELPMKRSRPSACVSA